MFICFCQQTVLQLIRFYNTGQTFGSQRNMLVNVNDITDGMQPRVVSIRTSEEV